MNAANSQEPNQPAPKSFWRMELSRWCKWFILWLILTAIPLCAACFYAGKHRSSNVACGVLVVLFTANYVMPLAALVKSFVKKK
jgi:hypothetical protein